MFSDQDKDIIYQLTAELIGTVQAGQVRQETLATNVMRRITQLGLPGLVDYLKYVDEHPEEHAHLVSALTIHTTSWFRENPHFVKFQELLLAALSRNETFRVWCAGCSTGEEVYSFALILEEFRQVHPQFDYRVVGTDIDPISVQTAIKAIYPQKQMNFHLGRYRKHLLEGSGKTEGYFTLSKEIRERCEFRVLDLRESPPVTDGLFHVIVCRNVLIYFDPETTSKIVTNLIRPLAVDGRLLLGHSEHIVAKDYGLVQEGHSAYAKPAPEEARKLKSTSVKYRVLSVDDSASTRKTLGRIFEDMGFESVTVASGSEATSYLNFNEVDLVTLDLNMPDISGDKWLRDERREGLRTPVVILSEVHPSAAPEVVNLLALGAQEYIEKSQLSQEPGKVKEVLLELIRSSRKVERAAARVGSRPFPKRRPDVVLIGASTGGPQALTKILSSLPPDSPSIMITQHISAKFSRPLAERLCSVSGLKLGLPDDGNPLRAGHLYMSFGDYHIGVVEKGGELAVMRSNAQAFNGHRPSVDVMFNSVLGINRPMMAVLLTGMGRDGALGMRFLRQEGVFCVAQGEEDCLVYGMPREAIERGAADFAGNLDEIHQLLVNSFQVRKAG